jgi:CheY-like chemotaxis protein
VGSLEILLVDDSDSDAKLIRLFAKKAKVVNPIRRVASGEAGLAYLESAEPLPGLVLLDINMPGMNGYDVLKAIRAHQNPAVAALPVVFLTSSDSPEEVAQAYREHVNSYVVKPVDMVGFQKILQGLSQYWFEIVEVPDPDRAEGP